MGICSFVAFQFVIFNLASSAIVYRNNAPDLTNQNEKNGIGDVELWESAQIPERNYPDFQRMSRAEDDMTNLNTINSKSSHVYAGYGWNHQKPLLKCFYSRRRRGSIKRRCWRVANKHPNDKYK